jgi:hypothetical protein
MQLTPKPDTTWPLFFSQPSHRRMSLRTKKMVGMAL